MKAVRIIFSIVFLVILASNVRLISHWNESRGVYDDICYLRQAHLFQRFGWQGLDTSLAREDDGYLAAKLRSINFENWKDGTKAPCHTQTADGKWVMTPPPGTGFVLALFPEGFQVIPLYIIANLIIAGFAMYALWRARQPPAVTVAAVFGALAIYFMMNPTKASYSMAPTMVFCALTGLLTARLFTSDDRPYFLMLGAIGLLLGLSVNFRIANVLLSAGYFLFLGVSFLIRRNYEEFLQGLAFGLGFLIGVLPVLVANTINSGNPLVSAYGGVDTQLPGLHPAVLFAYLADTQFLMIFLVGLWTALLRYLAIQSSVKRLTLLLTGNLALNVAFFVTRPVFVQYYTVPISMLTVWTLLFATILMRVAAQGDDVDGPGRAEMLSRKSA